MAAKKPTAKDSNTWVGKVEEYSRKIWLAGLGVYSKIDTDGSKLFDTLVKDGEKAEKLAKEAGHKVAEGVKSSTSSALAGWGCQGSGHGEVGRTRRGFRQAPKQRHYPFGCTQP